jgi:ribosomal protein L40E
MSDTAGAKTIDLKWFGTLSYKQLLGLVAAFVVALFLTLLGFGASCYCFGMLIIAVILYMLPRFLGLENIKIMTVVGIVFLVATVLIGGFLMAPGVVDKLQETPPATDGGFTDIDYNIPEGTKGEVNITATLVDSSDVTGVYFVYGEVRGIEFQGVQAAVDQKFTLYVNGNSVSGIVPLDSNKLYIGHLVLTNTDDSGNEVDNNDSVTDNTLLTGAYDGSLTGLSFYGCLISALYIVIIFFIIMILSNLMKGRMEKTREKMEKDGRLYPQGYGRCAKCGAVVLPGEVSCRKCGEYIDRPEDMKPKKKDFFECSECGAEVPTDAKECPKCGAVFDEDETEVTHADGTVETTNEILTCPECGAAVPATVSFCPHCGAKFGDKK